MGPKGRQRLVEDGYVAFAGEGTALAAGAADLAAVADQVRTERDQHRRRYPSTTVAMGGWIYHGAPRS